MPRCSTAISASVVANTNSRDMVHMSKVTAANHTNNLHTIDVVSVQDVHGDDSSSKYT